ncbi:uncharacterized protein LOC141909840 isoform X2 [Tubulanus polymorphus]|uniref:uncharacterized protein LOC141909840 isoform X2 n=1 Tax=Tubulanus polymorphus TaxID=672921 RepID=UPI003DA6734C
MAGSSVSCEYRSEFTVTFERRKVNVYSDEENESRDIANYSYQPLFKLECDLITVDGDLLQLPVTIWTEELETLIKRELFERQQITEEQISVQVITFDEVKLEWRAAPPGVEIPDLGIPFNHQPQTHGFIVKCSNGEMAENYKSSLQKSPQFIGAGLHVIGISRRGTQSFKVNYTEPITEHQTGTELMEPEDEHPTGTEDDVIVSLMINKQVDTDFSPTLVTSLPVEQAGRQSRIICARYKFADYIYSMNEDNEMERYIEFDCDEIQGLDTDSNGYLFALVKKNSKFYLRKYKDTIKLLEEDITDIRSGVCRTLILRDHKIYVQSKRDVHVLRLLENPVNSLIDRNRVKKYQLPGGEYKYINCLDVDSRERMFAYCMHTRRLLYLTAEAKLISFIYLKDFGLTFDPLVGRVCLISDKHVLLSVYSNTDNRGAVISIRYNDEGFIDPPGRIVMNSMHSLVCEMHKVCDSNTVVICHYDNSYKQDSLRVYNINTGLAQ